MNNSDIQEKVNSVKSKIEKLIEEGRLEEAKFALEKLEQKMPGDPEVCSMSAIISIIEGSFEKAESKLLDGLKKDSVHFDLLFNLAYIYEQRGQLQQAGDLYSKAGTVAKDQVQQNNITEAVERLKLIDSTIQSHDKDRIVFFVKEGMDSFLGDIIDGLSDRFWVRKMIISNLKQIDEGMEWADICWFEWCDELVAYGSRLPLAHQKKIVCRLHRYEVFSDVPAKVCWENVDKLIIVTRHLKDILETNLPGISEKVEITVVENGVDVNRFAFKKRSSGFNIAMVGYIHSRKNPVLLLQIIKKLADTDKRYKLYIAGAFQEQMVSMYWDYQVRRMGLEKNVIFEGWQDDINSWLEDKNYLLSTSIHESFGYGIAEAMARGIKPVIYDFLYANEIWDEGLLFGSADEAVAKIVKGDYESEKYREFIEKRYSLEKQLAEIKTIISELSSFRTITRKINDIISGSEAPNEVKVKDITVLIPCYNRAKMLKEDLDNSFKFGVLPKLIIDDCSSKEREWLDQIIEKADKYNAVIIPKMANEGVAQARFDGLQKIKTQYAIFDDDDDMVLCLDNDRFANSMEKLKDDYLFVIPRYVINLEGNKLSLGYDRCSYNNLTAAEVLKDIAAKSEIKMLAAGAVASTEKLKGVPSGREFKVSEDFVMLSRIFSENPSMKICVTESLVYVRRISNSSLSKTLSPQKLALGLIAQAVACYHCLRLEIASKENVLDWMNDRALLIQRLYNFGENFEADLLVYLSGEISEDAFLRILALIGIKPDKGLDGLAPELRKLRKIFYRTVPGSGKNIDNDKSEANLKEFSDICSKLYNINLVSSLSKSNKLFSIVIPTRNSTKYLRYTLMTCVNQNFDDYEIIVSDNSTPGNDDALRLVKELDSEKIRYIRPDKELSLAKSFEFAYLNSEGEYLFGLGSDDALLFHSMDCLNGLLNKYPNEKIILWDKLFYCWPGVSDKSQENLFFVSKMYHKDKVNVTYLDCDRFLRQILNFDVSMYMLPMAYINSAIHRSVIGDIIGKTGRFLDGTSQDVYTGLINLSLYDKLLYIMYPITIAGLSKNSIGFASQNRDESNIKESKMFAEKFNEQYTTEYIPQTMRHYDRTLMIKEFAKIIDRGINSWNHNMVNWKRFYALCAEHIEKNDFEFKKRMDDIFNTIKLHKNGELERWFAENYYYNKSFTGSDIHISTYQKGFFTDDNSLRIDMSRFGVSDIYGVADFFSNLYNI